MRKTPLRPGKGFGRRRQPVKRANPKRRESEFARTFGSAERVEWSHTCPCIACHAVPTECMHIKGGGGSRRADARFTVPACRGCHLEAHRLGIRTFAEQQDLDLDELAAKHEAAWRAHVGQVHGTPTRQTA